MDDELHSSFSESDEDEQKTEEMDRNIQSLSEEFSNKINTGKSLPKKEVDESSSQHRETRPLHNVFIKTPVSEQQQACSFPTSEQKVREVQETVRCMPKEPSNKQFIMESTDVEMRDTHEINPFSPEEWPEKAYLRKLWPTSPNEWSKVHEIRILPTKKANASPPQTLPNQWSEVHETETLPTKGANASPPQALPEEWSAKVHERTIRSTEVKMRGLQKTDLTSPEEWPEKAHEKIIRSTEVKMRGLQKTDQTSPEEWPAKAHEKIIRSTEVKMRGLQKTNQASPEEWSEDHERKILPTKEANASPPQILPEEWSAKVNERIIRSTEVEMRGLQKTNQASPEEWPAKAHEKIIRSTEMKMRGLQKTNQASPEEWSGVYERKILPSKGANASPPQTLPEEWSAKVHERTILPTKRANAPPQTLPEEWSDKVHERIIRSTEVKMRGLQKSNQASPEEWSEVHEGKILPTIGANASPPQTLPEEWSAKVHERRVVPTERASSSPPRQHQMFSTFQGTMGVEELYGLNQNPVHNVEQMRRLQKSLKKFSISSSQSTSDSETFEKKSMVYLPTAFESCQMDESCLVRLYGKFEVEDIKMFYYDDGLSIGSGTMTVLESEKWKVIEWAKNMKWKAQQLGPIRLQKNADSEKTIKIFVEGLPKWEDPQKIKNHFESVFNPKDFHLFHDGKRQSFGAALIELPIRNAPFLIENDVYIAEEKTKFGIKKAKFSLSFHEVYE